MNTVRTIVLGLAFAVSASLNADDTFIKNFRVSPFQFENTDAELQALTLEQALHQQEILREYLTDPETPIRKTPILTRYEPRAAPLNLSLNQLEPFLQTFAENLYFRKAGDHKLSMPIDAFLLPNWRDAEIDLWLDLGGPGSASVRAQEDFHFGDEPEDMPLIPPEAAGFQRIKINGSSSDGQYWGQLILSENQTDKLPPISLLKRKSISGKLRLKLPVKYAKFLLDCHRGLKQKTIGSIKLINAECRQDSASFDILSSVAQPTFYALDNRDRRIATPGTQISRLLEGGKLFHELELKMPPRTFIGHRFEGHADGEIDAIALYLPIEYAEGWIPVALQKQSEYEKGSVYALDDGEAYFSQITTTQITANTRIWLEQEYSAFDDQDVSALKVALPSIHNSVYAKVHLNNIIVFDEKGQATQVPSSGPHLVRRDMYVSKQFEISEGKEQKSTVVRVKGKVDITYPVGIEILDTKHNNFPRQVKIVDNKVRIEPAEFVAQVHHSLPDGSWFRSVRAFSSNGLLLKLINRKGKSQWRFADKPQRLKLTRVLKWAKITKAFDVSVIK